MIAENAFFGWSAEREKAFWDEKLATIKGSGKEEIKLRQDVRTEIFAIEKKGANDALQTTIGNLKLEQESAKLTGKERISIQDEILAAIEAAGARETSIYRNAQLERERLVQREAVFEIEQQQKILEANLEASKTIIESKINEVNTQYELGNISSERQLVQLKTLLNQKYKLELDTFHRIAALWDQYPEKYQESQNKISLAAAKHSKEIGAVENKASLQVASEWKKGFDSIAQSMNINWIGVLKGTQTLQDQMIGIGENIANQMINAFWRMAVEQIAAETVAAIPAKSVTGQTSMSKIYSHAASAAVGAYDAFASIPYVGPIIGAIAAAAVFAACIAYGAYVGSAAGGWDVDKDSLAYVHKDEMVLPAGIAEGFRDIIAGRGTPGAGSPQQTIRPTFNIRSWDSQDTRRMLIRHGPTIYKTLFKQGRQYGIR